MQQHNHLSSLDARTKEKSEKKKGSCVLQMFLNQLRGLLEGAFVSAGWGLGADGRVGEEEVGDDATGGGAVMLGALSFG
jgi:hypothetical protein